MIVFRARLKPVSTVPDCRYFALCGRPDVLHGGSCGAFLAAVSLLHDVRDADRATVRDMWIATRNEGFTTPQRRSGVDYYAVLTGTPAAYGYVVSCRKRRGPTVTGRSVGRQPELPVVVECPLCRRLNLVSLDDA